METNLADKSNLGFKHILLKKLSCAVSVSISSQIVLLFMFLFLINVDLIHPWHWQNYLSIFTSFYMWIYMIPFATIIFAQTIICAKDYVLVFKFSSTRFMKFISIFSLHNFILLILHVISGGLVVWLYLALGGGKYAEFTKKCEDEKVCIVEGKFYLILGGLWSGLYYFLNMYASDKKIKFPVVYQYKLLQFKAQFLPIIRKCKSDAFWPSIYFVMFYYLFGNATKTYVCNVFNLKEETETGFMIYICLWIFTSLYFVKMRLMSLFFELFLTEPVYFPIESVHKDDLTLGNAVTVSHIPIVQHLACYNLYMLSYWCPNRRKQLYAVSQPGGHPHNWNALLLNVLNIIETYTQDLNKSATVILEPEKKVVPLSNTVHAASCLSPPVKPRHANIRNMSCREPEPLNIVNVSLGNMNAFTTTKDSITSKTTQKINLYINTIKQKLGINFIFGELPEANIQHCLANGQIMIWISQGLASLAVFAINEDTFGVVQKDLPVIISTLYELKMNLEKLNRLPSLSKRGSDDYNVKMKIALNAAVKRSILNISRAYFPFLKDLNLKKEVLQYIHSLSNVRNYA